MGWLLGSCRHTSSGDVYIVDYFGRSGHHRSYDVSLGSMVPSIPMPPELSGSSYPLDWRLLKHNE